MTQQKVDPALKPVGQALQKFNKLYVLVRDTLARHKVSAADLVTWLVGAGRNVFVSEFLEPLIARFKATQQRVRTIDKTTILVNLDADPILPFPGTGVITNTKGGWVKVQLRRNGHLYVDGRRMELYLSEKQKSGTQGLFKYKGHDLKEELDDKRIPVLHPNIMDALIDYAPHLIPEELKTDEQGRARTTFWWAVVFGNSYGDLFVRFLCGRVWRYYLLDVEWCVDNPAAVASLPADLSAKA